jgi:hypothetical protein
MFVINIVPGISHLFAVTVNKKRNNVPFSAIIIFFFRVALNVLVCTPGIRVPQVRNHCPRWMTLYYFNRFDQCFGHCLRSRLITGVVQLLHTGQCWFPHLSSPNEDGYRFSLRNMLLINLSEPRVLYKGRAYRYPPDVAFYIFFSTNIGTEYFKHAAHSPFFFSKCRLFHNGTLFWFLYYSHFTYRVC